MRMCTTFCHTLVGPGIPRLLPLLALLALAGCDPASRMPSGAAPHPMAQEAGAVYAVLLDSLRHHAPGAPLKHRYVQVETDSQTPRRSDDYLLRSVPEVTPELLARFHTAGQQSADLRAVVRGRGVEWITRDSLDTVMRRMLLDRSLPPAADFSTTRFSPVGFSADGRHALVYVTYWCGGLCADEHWVLLERRPDGRWSIRRSLLTVIS